MADTCPQHLSDYLLKQFSLSDSELYRVNGPVNLTRLFSITGLASHPELQCKPFTPVIPKALQNSENIFNVVSKQDILLLHPFESFTPVVDLLRQAAKDPHVLAIKQTLYRSGANSEIVDALVVPGIVHRHKGDGVFTQVCHFAYTSRTGAGCG